MDGKDSNAAFVNSITVPETKSDGVIDCDSDRECDYVNIIVTCAVSFPPIFTYQSTYPSYNTGMWANKNEDFFSMKMPNGLGRREECVCVSVSAFRVRQSTLPLSLS